MKKLPKSEYQEPYQKISRSHTVEEIEKELELRRILELRDDLKTSERLFRNKYGNVCFGKQLIEFYGISECELRDAVTLIKNRGGK
jgi:hypothetical protein